MTTLMPPMPAVAEEDLAAIADGVWESFLDTDGTGTLVPAEPGGSLGVSAAVSVTGAWQGHVLIGLSESGAREVTTVLTGLPITELGDAELVDAVGELANIVGGNVKSLLPGPSELSLPHVLVCASGAQTWLALPAAHEVCRVDRAWRGKPVRISVWAQTEEARSDHL